MVCRNARTQEAQGPEEHGSAFIVGRIKDVVPSTETPGRWLITFSEYALVDWKDEWEGRNPVAYFRTDDYDDIDDFENLQFHPMLVFCVPVPSQPMTIAKAKSELALAFGVSAESVEIVIRG